MHQTETVVLEADLFKKQIVIDGLITGIQVKDLSNTFYPRSHGYIVTVCGTSIDLRFDEPVHFFGKLLRVGAHLRCIVEEKTSASKGLIYREQLNASNYSHMFMEIDGIRYSGCARYKNVFANKEVVLKNKGVSHEKCEEFLQSSPAFRSAINYKLSMQTNSSLSEHDVAAMFIIQRTKCAYTDRQLTPDDFSIDRKHPHLLGGRYTIENCVLTTKEINVIKGACMYQTFLCVYRKTVEEQNRIKTLNTAVTCAETIPVQQILPL